jgi:hypothetical protein
LDDSKSVNGSYLHFIIAAQQEVKLQKLVVLTRKKDDSCLRPNADEFIVDHSQVLSKLGFAAAERTQAPQLLEKASA